MSWHCPFVDDFARHDKLPSSMHWTIPPDPISGTPGKNPRQRQVFTLEIQVYPPLPQNPLFSWIHGLRLMSSRRSRGLAVEIAETDHCRAKGQQGLGPNFIGIVAAAAQPPNFPPLAALGARNGVLFPPVPAFH